MPGAMGVGLYIVWPAFYTDISASHTLPRRGRLRADLGGIYFSALASILIGGIAVLIGFEALLVVVLILQFEMARQLLPLLRLDGYYVVSDLVGVPDLFGRIGPILLSFLPGRKDDPRVTQLKPWVRTVVSIWVVAVVAFITYYTIFLLLALPRLIGTGWQSFVAQWHAAGAAIGNGAWATAALSILQLFILSAPAFGIAYMIWNIGRRWWRWWQALSGHPLGRAALALVTALAVGLLLWAWWPKPGAYAPIGPNERWTVGEVAPAISRLTSERGSTLGSDRATTRGGGAPAPATTPSPASTHPSPSAASTPSPAPSSTASPSPSPRSSPSVTASPSVSASLSPTPSPTP
jgi:putative peptide zinc metalloprotease protein